MGEAAKSETVTEAPISQIFSFCIIPTETWINIFNI